MTGVMKSNRTAIALLRKFKSAKFGSIPVTFGNLTAPVSLRADRTMRHQGPDDHIVALMITPVSFLNPGGSGSIWIPTQARCPAFS